jgi:hypothetical protein
MKNGTKLLIFSGISLISGTILAASHTPNFGFLFAHAIVSVGSLIAAAMLMADDK